MSFVIVKKNRPEYLQAFSKDIIMFTNSPMVARIYQSETEANTIKDKLKKYAERCTVIPL